MSPEEVEKLLKRDEEIAKQREGERTKNVSRPKGTFVTASFTLDETLYKTFQAQAKEDGVTVTQVLRAAALSYTFKELKVDRTRLVSNAPVQAAFVSRETSHISSPTAPVGRPRKAKPGYNEDGTRMAWYEGDHSSKAIWDFRMPQQPHPAVDPRPHLDMETRGKVTGTTYCDMLHEEFWKVRETFTMREWEGKYREFASCCAMKFFTLNKEEHIRYEEDLISEDLYLWNSNIEALYVTGTENILHKEVK